MPPRDLGQRRLCAVAASESATPSPSSSYAPVLLSQVTVTARVGARVGPWQGVRVSFRVGSPPLSPFPFPLQHSHRNRHEPRGTLCSDQGDVDLTVINGGATNNVYLNQGGTAPSMRLFVESAPHSISYSKMSSGYWPTFTCSAWADVNRDGG